MSKATTNSETWRSRSACFSTHGSRRGVNLLGWDSGAVEDMTPEQERQALQARARQLHQILADRSLKRAQRQPYIAEFVAVNARINEIRPYLKTPGIEKFVLDVLRERLSKQEWKALFDEAKRRWTEWAKDQPNAVATNQRGGD